MNKRLALECGVLTGAAIFALLTLPLPEPLNNLRGANKGSVREAEYRKRPDAIFEEHGIRPVYPHSLIPGGVRDAKEFGRVLASDPRLANFFRGFDATTVRPCTLPQGRYFVTVREGQSITWSKRPIEKGNQPCLTDGIRTILTKCGNEVAFTPQDPSQEITSEEIAGPVWEPITGTETTIGPVNRPNLLQAVTPPTNGSQLQNYPSVPYPPILGIPVPPVVILPSPPVTVQVPEPGTLGLASVGMFIFGFAAWFNKRMRMR